MEKEKLNNNALSDVAGGEESEQNGDKCPNCGSTNTTMDLAVLMHYCISSRFIFFFSSMSYPRRIEKLFLS